MTPASATGGLRLRDSSTFGFDRPSAKLHATFCVTGVSVLPSNAHIE
jgi:hypothetical protein